MTGVWETVEIACTAQSRYRNPYLDVDVWADFVRDGGPTLRRPAFFDGGDTWRVRFAAPTAGRWRWQLGASVDDPGLRDRSGDIDVDAGIDTDAGNDTEAEAEAEAEADIHIDADELSGSRRFRRHGFWRMSPGGRSLVHADGTPAVLVADTAWALPFRADLADVEHYAADRQRKGFNAALLMTVQPDMDARGPRDRHADQGFDVGFEDLALGRLTELNPGYFQTLDGLLDVLAAHGIVPVLQPVFHGFGWKGQRVAGPVVPPQDYARYCRYLVARYGAAPAVYLVGADGWGTEPQIRAGGEEISAWDCYGQPTGIHYNPAAGNREHQGSAWLDFQWCQTGHGGEHVPERVADMWRNDPPKAVANGEPTYERTRQDGMAEGWWQGHEAWSNLCAGATMGVVYGAANLWQWKHHAGEPGHEAYFLAASGSWRDALGYPGSTYVGLVGRILDGLPTTDLSPDWSTFLAPRGLHVPGVLQITYQEDGGPLIPMRDADLPRHYRVVDPLTGQTLEEGEHTPGTPIDGAHDRPRLVIFHDAAPPGPMRPTTPTATT